MKATRKSHVFAIGKLNDYYKDLVKNPTRYKWMKGNEDDWYRANTYIIRDLTKSNKKAVGLDYDNRDTEILTDLGTMQSCCGVGELGYFMEPQHNKYVEREYDEYIACQVKAAFKNANFCIYATNTSNYYEKIVGSLERLGFGVIARNYPNKHHNGKTRIVMLGALK